MLPANVVGQHDQARAPTWPLLGLGDANPERALRHRSGTATASRRAIGVASRRKRGRYPPRGGSCPTRGTFEPFGAQSWPAVIVLPTAPIPASRLASIDVSPAMRGTIAVTGSPS